MNDMNLFIPELHGAFSGRRFFGKADLRNFYQKQFFSLSETAFRRILYALERREQIIAVDAGVYQFPDLNKRPHALKKFTPSLSAELRQVDREVKAAFPYAETMIWETRLVHEFMLHQPGQSQIILETDKEVAESVFNFLNTRFVGRTFLWPSRVTFERYILPRSDSVIITSLLTQTPHQKVEDIPTPKLEKILVDIFSDEDIFYIFHGEEMTHIFETAFERYQVSQKSLFRYAERRKVGSKIRSFIKQQTKIQLIRP
ncbi:MAG TPA: hypothetical protein PKM21_15775 [Anaerolineales bacterium]|nr:hypothetical protein [Anaerolineales bacterium]